MWVTSAGLGAIGAALGWFAAPALGMAVSPAGDPYPSVIAAAIGLGAGAVAIPLGALLWAYWQAPWRAVQELAEHVSALEEVRTSQPSIGVRFEYDRESQRVRLHVINHGGAAVFAAPMNIDGALSAPVDHQVFAAWEHTEDVGARIVRGETRVLHLATLVVERFPYAQWRMRVTTEGRGISEVCAMHASMVGGLPDTQAPRLLLSVSLVSEPEASDGVPNRVVALDPFSASLVTR